VLANALNLLDPSLTFSFQVGYYGEEAGKSENIQTSRLSTTFVPEPGTLILLGTGLLGLGILGRKKFRARS